MHTPHCLRAAFGSYFVHIGSDWRDAAKIVLHVSIGKLFRIASKIAVEAGR